MVRLDGFSVQTVTYSAPQISAQTFAVEEGFSLSQNAGLPGEDPKVNDFGEF